MISGVTREIAGKSETFRMNNRAKRAIESRMGKGIIALFSEMDKEFTFEFMTVALAESMNDGAGASMERADAVVDEIGVAEAGDLLGKIGEAAFPEVDDSEANAKNGKGAARSK